MNRKFTLFLLVIGIFVVFLLLMTGAGNIFGSITNDSFFDAMILSGISGMPIIFGLLILIAVVVRRLKNPSGKLSDFSLPVALFSFGVVSAFGYLYFNGTVSFVLVVVASPLAAFLTYYLLEKISFGNYRVGTASVNISQTSPLSSAAKTQSTLAQKKNKWWFVLIAILIPVIIVLYYSGFFNVLISGVTEYFVPGYRCIGDYRQYGC